jgi:hypothetical protein
MLPWRYRVIPRAVSYPAALPAWLVAILPVLAAAFAYGEFHQSIRLVSTDPAPLYAAPGVGALHTDWAQTGMQVAWQGVPQKLGEPPPDAVVSVTLFRDRQQFSFHLQQFFGLLTPPNAPACTATAVGGERVIWCDASSFRSRGGAIHMLAHELTHHVVAMGLRGQSSPPRWYSEGLAEYVGIEVLADYLRQESHALEGMTWREWGAGAQALPTYAERHWRSREVVSVQARQRTPPRRACPASRDTLQPRHECDDAAAGGRAWRDDAGA